MTANENATSQLITEDDVLAFYDEQKGRGIRERRNKLWEYYALKPLDVWALIKKQGGYCPICRRVLTLQAGHGVGVAIDHEGRKKQGHVRGVLHVQCNTLLGLLEETHGDPDSKPTINLPRKYLDNPPAKKIKVGDSNLHHDTIEDRKDRGRPGRKCQREGCAKTIPATKPLQTKYCNRKCQDAVSNASKWASRRATLPDRKCLQCGDPIDDDAHLKQKYCDLKCRQKAEFSRRRESRREILPDRKCLQCGDPIDDDAHLKQKYCDLKCRRGAAKARQAA